MKDKSYHYCKKCDKPITEFEKKWNSELGKTRENCLCLECGLKNQPYKRWGKYSKYNYWNIWCIVLLPLLSLVFLVKTYASVNLFISGELSFALSVGSFIVWLFVTILCVSLYRDQLWDRWFGQKNDVGVTLILLFLVIAFSLVAPFFKEVDNFAKSYEFLSIVTLILVPCFIVSLSRFAKHVTGAKEIVRIADDSNSYVKYTEPKKELVSSTYKARETLFGDIVVDRTDEYRTVGGYERVMFDADSATKGAQAIMWLFPLYPVIALVYLIYKQFDFCFNSPPKSTKAYERMRAAYVKVWVYNDRAERMDYANRTYVISEKYPDESFGE